MKFSIRFKLLTIGIISVGCSALSVFIVSLQEHKSIYAESVKTNLQALTINTADDLLLQLSVDSDPFLLRSTLLRFERYEHLKYAILYSKNWDKAEVYIQPKLFSQVAQNLLAIPEVDPKKLQQGVSIEGSNIYALQPIDGTGNIGGYLLVAHEYLQPLDNSQKDLIRLTSPLLILILLITTAAMLLTIRQQLVPLMNLSKFTRNITRTKEYGSRFQVRGDDEIYTLGQDINSMLEVIDSEITLNAEQTQQLTEQREALYHLANYDQLTNLPNRRHVLYWLTNIMDQARKNDQLIGVLYFDVDHFKSVNDRMGHDVGDKLLIEVGRIVASFLKHEQVVARLAGDEFLVVLPKLQDKMEAVAIARKLTSGFSVPISIDRWSIQTGISVGVADTEDSGYRVDDLLNYADIAMYHSKHFAKGTVTRFHPQMLVESHRHTLIVNSIVNASRNNEFQLYYQPKISAAGEVCGLEALIRWENDTLGSLSPCEFIPIAETSGKISEITRWVMDKVLKDLPEIIRSSNTDIVVSFNISSVDMSSDWFEPYLLQMIEDYPDFLRHLQFEITESNYLNDYKSANKFFKLVQEAGGSVALDDFGTGFSSLSYLGRIDIDTIKVDREFIVNFLNDRRDRAVLKAILDLTNSLGLNSCCEGIENVEQAKYLIANGCGLMQGFYFSTATPIEQISDAIELAKQRYRELELFS